MYLKNFLIFAMIILLEICLPVSAISDSEYISAIEQNLFSAQFATENINNRLNRIEKYAFGMPNNAPVEQRIKKIKKAFGNLSYEAPSRQIPPQAANFNNNFQPKNNFETQRNTPIQYPQTQLTQYPIIDEIELNILDKTFPQENIYKRLDKIETAIFNRTFNDTLDNRVERLRVTVIGVPNVMSKNYNAPVNPLNSGMALDNESINKVLSELEQQTFNQVYQNEFAETRLSRLENHIFNQASPEDEIESRLERLVTVIAAQPTSELYNDMSKINQYQMLGTRITAAALIMMLVKGLFF